MEQASGLVAARSILEYGRFHTLKTSDGVALRCWSQRNDTAPHIVVTPGRGEFIEKYYEIIQGLVIRGLSVTCFDWRGHGLSQRDPAARGYCHVGSFDHYLLDLDAVHHHVTLGSAKSDVVFLAQSMGSHMVLRWLQRKTGVGARAILVSPMLDIQLGSKRAVVSVAARLLSAIGFTHSPIPSIEDQAFADNDLTTDAARYEEQIAMRRECPGLSVGRPTWGWLNAAITSCNGLKVPTFFDEFQAADILFVYSLADTVISVSTIEQAVARLPRSQSVTLNEARHEIMRETDRVLDQFWKSIDAFMK